MISQAWTYFLQYRADVVQRLIEHCGLVFFSMSAALALGLPLTFLLRRQPRLSSLVVFAASVVQTIPSLALLGLLLPLLGVGKTSAIAALFLYSLLPIISGTLAGLGSIDVRLTEAARAIGMTPRQTLWRVELPLAMPAILAGIRTAAAINVGVAMLSAFIGAGGLGALVFRGIATNQPDLVMLGAIPAALMALGIDAVLAWVQRSSRHQLMPWRRLIFVACSILVVTGMVGLISETGGTQLKLGVTTGFLHRPDGYQTLRTNYMMPAFTIKEMNASLVYEALRLHDIDIATGHKTDGRITVFGLRVLDDDRDFFPGYRVGPLVRAELLTNHPDAIHLLKALAGAINDKTMRRLNSKVDGGQMTPRSAATEFLAQWTRANGIIWNADAATDKLQRGGKPDLVIGARNFTEQYIISQILAQLINGATPLRASLRTGLGSSNFCFEALARGEIDLYTEDAGDILVNILNADSAQMRKLARDADQDADELRQYIDHELSTKYRLRWLPAFGFGREYTLLVRSDDARFKNLHSISDLQTWMSVSKPAPH